MNKEQEIKKWLIEADYKLKDLQEILKTIHTLNDQDRPEINHEALEQHIKIRVDERARQRFHS